MLPHSPDTGSTNHMLATAPGAVALAVALALAGARATAAPPPGVDTSEWECKECPFDDGGKVESDYEVGLGYVDDSSARYGRYSGLDEEGGHAVLNGQASQQLEDGWRWDVDAKDLGLDARRIGFRGGRPGLDVRLSYDQLPNNLYDTTRTPYADDGEGFLTLPSDFVRAGNTGAMTTLNPSLEAVDIGTERRAVSAGLLSRLGEAWSAYGDYRHEKRDGTRRLGAAFGFSAIELPRPVEDATDALEFGVRYAGSNLSATLGYDGSFYSNKRSTVTYDNAYLGSALGRTGLEPDSSAQQLMGSVNWRFSPLTLLSATAAFGQLRQDDELAPYTVNRGLPVTPLPRGSADAKVDTLHGAVAFTTGLDGLGSVFRTARIKVDARYDERDNSTPVARWQPIVTDSFTSSPSDNQPYDFEHLRFGASGDYDLRTLMTFLPESQKLRISGGYRRDEISRTLQEGADTVEDTGWGRVTWQPFGWAGLAVKWGGANREVDEYVAVPAIIPPQNPLLRKFYMADRERQFVDGTLTIQAHERLSLVATGRYNNDDYVNSKIGLIASRERGATIGATWTPFDGASVFADYGWDRVTSRQNGSANYAATDWFSDSEDRFNTTSFGFNFTGIGQALDLDARAYFADSSGDTLVTRLGGSAEALPQLRTRLNGAEVGVSWSRSAALGIRAAIRYEHFDQDDYALDNVVPATVPTLLSLGAEAYDYDITSFLVSFRYRFGATGAATPSPAKSPEE
jgi:MtrB/PioB family decaheme-associated outer membrane protein